MSVPLLHVVSPQGIVDDSHFAETAAAMQAACGRELAIHIRDPAASGGQLYRLARALADGAAVHGGWCVVNERTDVALAAGAQAAQLGHRALPLDAARRVVGDRMALGVSAHSMSETRAANAGGANYAVLGTIFPSPSHPGTPPLGIVALSDSRACGLPIVAIGGVSAERVNEVMGAGASGIAVLSAVWDARDPVASAVDLLERMLAARSAAIGEND